MKNTDFVYAFKNKNTTQKFKYYRVKWNKKLKSIYYI